MQSTGYPQLDALLPRLDQVPALDSAALDAEHTAILGRKAGALTEASKSIPTLPPEQRRGFGAAVNQVKAAFEQAFEQRRAALAEEARRQQQAGMDRTMPARHRWTGSRHPVTATIDEISQIFRTLGFVTAVGPETETEWFNFGALNFPPNHPAM